LLKEWFLADRTYGCSQPQDEWLGSPSLAADYKGVACSLAQDRQPVHSKADIWDKDIPWDSLDPETLQRILRTLAETTG
jgi:hypothetical protein